MTGVLFWNVRKNNVAESVARMAAVPTRHIQIVALAEMDSSHG